ncbi:MAG: hypothetical protein Q7S87_03245 [Agitococcus sp.]|nr:hypothetical protein [Agitococcus sp.]MDO9178651.1 hypothetical protein [Agitococcus sp.]
MQVQIIGKFYALPHSREYEIHQADGTVTFGKIYKDVSLELIQELNAFQTLCVATVVHVGRQPPMLTAIRAA